MTEIPSHRAPAWAVLDRNACAASSEVNIAELEHLLVHPYQWFRIQAAEMLGAARAEQSLALLGAALNDRSVHVAEAAAAALAAIGTPHALALLRCSFEDDQVEKPHYLSSAIATFGEDGFEVLCQCIRHASPTIRFHAARGLGSTGYLAAEPVLRELSQTDFAKTRTGALVATAAAAGLKTLARIRCRAEP